MHVKFCNFALKFSVNQYFWPSVLILNYLKPQQHLYRRLILRLTFNPGLELNQFSSNVALVTIYRQFPNY